MSDRATAEALVNQAAAGDVVATRALCDCLFELGDPRADLLRRRLKSYDAEVTRATRIAAKRVEEHDHQLVQFENAQRFVDEVFAETLRKYEQETAEWEAARQREAAESSTLTSVVRSIWSFLAGPPAAPARPQPPLRGSLSYLRPAGERPNEAHLRTGFEALAACRLQTYAARLMRTRPGAPRVVRGFRAGAPVVW